MALIYYYVMIYIIHCANNFNETNFYYQIESLSNFISIHSTSEKKFSIPNNSIHYFH